MRVTILPENGLVAIDGVTHTGLSFVIDPAIHAVQGIDGKWTVEFKPVQLLGMDEPRIPLNIVLTTSQPFENAMAAWRLAESKPAPAPPADDPDLSTFIQDPNNPLPKTEE
jgi:hypothetical protein